MIPTRSHGVIFALALGLRVLGVLRWPVEPTSDAADYHALAVRVAEGRGYVTNEGIPTAWRPPLYPFALAAVYRITAVSPVASGLFQAILGAATVLLIMECGRILLSPRAGIVAGCLAALYPPFVWMPRVLLSENLALPLSVALLWLTARFLDSTKPALLWASGILSGLLLLTRPASAGLIALLAMVALASSWRRMNPRVTLAAMCGALALCAVTVLPWAIRNGNAMGGFVPFATQDGITLYSSYYPPESGGKSIWGDLASAQDPVVAGAPRGGGETLVSSYYKRATLQRLKEEPARPLLLAPTKLLWLSVPFDWDFLPRSRAGDRAFNWGYVLLLLLSLPGIAAIRSSERWKVAALIVPLLAAAGTAIVFYGAPRFRMLAEPSLILLAAAFLARIKLLHAASGEEHRSR